MDDSVQKSCWGVAALTVAGFAVVLALVLLFGSNEPVTVAIAS
ncbi:hypothetical protein [Mangrovibrevibacter kandeliae]|nr:MULTISPECIES: hypothetical protein [unclassified Aurantimonas]MCQ8782479.1 hypothetical protein [Aurantimonas sp. CSK15Z-1]MCW4114712.1 hypothetical protein [Aurantimonas sp. MSK8Z-1]